MHLLLCERDRPDYDRMHDGGLLTQVGGLGWSGDADICCLCDAIPALFKRMLFDQLPRANSAGMGPAIACDKSARQDRRHPTLCCVARSAGLTTALTCRCVHVFFRTLRDHHFYDPIQERAQRGPVFATSAMVDGWRGRWSAEKARWCCPGTPRRRGSDGRERQSPMCFHRLAAHRFAASRYVMHRLDRGECQKATASAEARQRNLDCHVGPTVESQRRRGGCWR
jgi:hypothetical protein